MTGLHVRQARVVLNARWAHRTLGIDSAKARRANHGRRRLRQLS